MRDFWLLTASGVLAKLADGLMLFLVPLAMLHASGSVAVAVASFAARGAAYAVAPMIGFVIDRYDRKYTYVVSQGLQAGCLALVALNLDNVLVAVILLAVSGLGGVVSNISSFYVLIPDMVAPERLSKALSRYGALTEAAKMTAPLIAGVLTAWVGGFRAVAAVAGLYVISCAVAMALERISDGMAPNLKLNRHSLGEGFRHLRKSQGLIALVAAMAFSNLGVGAMDTIYVTQMAHGGLDSTRIGILATVAGLCGVAGIWFADRLGRRHTIVRRILGWQVIVLIGAIGLTMPHPVIATGCFCLISFGLGGSNMNSIRYRQDSIPREVAGRVNAAMRMFIAGSVPISGLLFGAFSASTSQEWHWIPVVSFTAIGVVVWWRFSRLASKREVFAAV